MNEEENMKAWGETEDEGGSGGKESSRYPAHAARRMGCRCETTITSRLLSASALSMDVCACLLRLSQVWSRSCQALQALPRLAGWRVETGGE